MRGDLQAETEDGDVELPARDEAAALAATAGDAALADELLATLLEALPGDLERLTGYLRTADWPRVAEMAHRMRGATTYCGATALDAALRALERAAKAADGEEILCGARRVEGEAKRLQGPGPR